MKLWWPLNQPRVWCCGQKSYKLKSTTVYGWPRKGVSDATFEGKMQKPQSKRPPLLSVKDSRYFNLIRGEAESSQADYERYQSRRRKSRAEEAEGKRQRPTEEEQYDFFTKVRYIAVQQEQNRL